MSNISKRIVKQIIYGLFYLLVIAGIIYAINLIIIFNRPPSCLDNRQNQAEEGIDCGGPCVPCGLEGVSPIAIGAAQVLEVNDSTLSVLAEIKNPNFDFGVEIFDYSFDFYDFDGNKISSIADTSFIYPGEIKIISAPVVRLNFGQVARSELVISNQTWIDADKFIRPNIQIRDTNTKTIDDSAVVTGLIINNGNYSLTRAIVTVIVANDLGFRLGVSKTVLQDVLAGEQRFFLVTIPLGDAQSVDVGSTKVFVEPRR